jgi:hypothetical protein
MFSKCVSFTKSVCSQNFSSYFLLSGYCWFKVIRCLHNIFAINKPKKPNSEKTFFITLKIKSPAKKTDHHRFEEAVVRLILIDLTTNSLFNPVWDRNKFAIFESLGLDNREARTWVKNKRYKLKVERDTNYPKFKAACAAAQVPCPDDNNWLQDLKVEEFDLDNLPEEIEQEEEVMAPASSKMAPSPGQSNRMLLSNSPHQYENSKFYLHYN